MVLYFFRFASERVKPFTEVHPNNANSQNIVNFWQVRPPDYLYQYQTPHTGPPASKIRLRRWSFVVNLSAVLGVQVTSKVELALKRPGARVAGKWLEPGMLSTVCDQVRRLAESLVALSTNVRLLAC